MDGQTNPNDAANREAMRQERVYEEAMRSINEERTRQQAAGYAALAAMGGASTAADGSGALGVAVKAAKIFLILFAGFAPNYLVYSVLLNG